jgi:hypothetical protein
VAPPTHPTLTSNQTHSKWVGGWGGVGKCRGVSNWVGEWQLGDAWMGENLFFVYIFPNTVLYVRLMERV